MMIATFVALGLPRLGSVGFLAQVSAELLLLAAGLLVYRTFRQRYLLAWNAGWLSYLLYRLMVEFSGLLPEPRLKLILIHVLFLSAIILFASAIFSYTNHRAGLLPYVVVALVAFDVALVRALWWPASPALLYLLHGLHLVITAGAAWQLARFSRGRRIFAPWLLALTLLPVHLHETAWAADYLSGVDLVLELVLGMSMLMMVLDDARDRARRLRAIHAVATVVSQAQEFGPMVRTALAELQTLTEAKAAWFRMLEGEQLVLVEHIGLPETYVRSRPSVSAHKSYSGRALREGMPAMIRAAAAEAETRERLRGDGFDHVLILPMRGKTSMLGCLLLGFARPHAYTADEMQFLAAIANQIGIAAENLRMFEQILRSRKHWVNTFDAIKDAIFVHTQGFRILRTNRALLKRVGRPYHEVLEQSCEAALPHAAPWSGCPYCSGGARDLTATPDPCFGGFSLVSTSAYTEPDGTPGTVHVVADVTDRHAAEERYRTLFGQVQEGVFISTPEGRLLDCNDAFVRLLGYESREQLLAVDIAKHLYAQPGQREAFRREMAARGAVRNYEVSLRRKDGALVTVLETSFASRDAQGGITRYQGFLLDITEKKRAENEIRQRNRELHALNAIAVVATQSLDLDEILNVTLRHVVELFQADTGAVYLFHEEKKLLLRRAAHGHRSEMGKHLPEVRLPDGFWEYVRRSHTEVVTPQHMAQVPPLVTRFVELEGLHSWIWVIMWAKDKIVGVLGISCRREREFTAGDENLMVAIGRQVATTIEKVYLYEETCRAYEDLRRTQEQLLQSEKMSAVGQLISGVAHELNNPLTAILGYTQLLEQEELDERVRDFIEKLQKQAHRTHRIVQNLLSFSRQRKPAKAEVDLRQVLEDTLSLRDYDLKLSNIAVERDFQGALPLAFADAHQIEQVFLNVINNSVDAMLDAARGGLLQVRIFAEHGFVCTEFRDTGPGIRDPKRVFDPFYTTKSVGKGTGLGLSICYGIVKEHGGEILARNHPDCGAVFTVRLPVAVGEGRAEPVARSAAQPLPVSGRILIVDDEEAVLEFEREVLTGAGARVVAMSRGEEAIACLQSEEFDAIILDTKMPGGWSGVEIFRWVRENRPDMEKKILFALSDLNDPRIRAFLESTGCLCIVKPFEVKDLVAMTRRLLQPVDRAATSAD